MNHASGFGSLRLVEATAKDLSLYGLDDPKAQIDVDFSDGGTFSMAVGDEEKVSGNYYGMVLSDDEKNNVYLFAKEDLIYFLLRKEAYISSLVTPELAVSSPLSAIRDITFSGTALSQPVTITAVKGADQETILAAKSFGPATHIVRLKGVYELDQTYGIQILGSVLGIRALDVAAYNVTDKELTKMGLDDPYMQVDFSLQNGTDYIADYQLRLVPSGGNYLAYMLGSGVVFLISPPDFVSIDATKLCLRWFLSPLRSDLSDLTVEFDDEKYVYTSGNDEEGNITAQVNGQSMDTEQFFKFYRLVTSAASDGVYLEDPTDEGTGTIPKIPDNDNTGIVSENSVNNTSSTVSDGPISYGAGTVSQDLANEGAGTFSQEPVNEDAPVMTITYRYNIEGKSPDVMKLYPGSLRRLNVQINGITEFDMRSAFADAVKNACRHSKSGEEIEENW